MPTALSAAVIVGCSSNAAIACSRLRAFPVPVIGGQRRSPPGDSFADRACYRVATHLALVLAAVGIAHRVERGALRCRIVVAGADAERVTAALATVSGAWAVALAQ